MKLPAWLLPCPAHSREVRGNIVRRPWYPTQVMLDTHEDKPVRISSGMTSTTSRMTSRFGGWYTEEYALIYILYSRFLIYNFRIFERNMEAGNLHPSACVRGSNQSCLPLSLWKPCSIHLGSLWSII
ncbi:hypothetical protein LEMLEM_LOCUS7771 [Lemmus lemmus]